MVSREAFNQLKSKFLEIFDPALGLSMMGWKTRYKKEIYIPMHLPGCTPCQTNSTFEEIWSEIEDLYPDLDTMAKKKTTNQKQTTSTPKKQTTSTPKKKNTSAPKRSTIIEPGVGGLYGNNWMDYVKPVTAQD